MGIGKTERNTVQRVVDLGIFREFMTSVRRNAANLFSGNLAEHANHAVSDRLRGFVRGLNGQQNLYQPTVQGAIDRSVTEDNIGLRPQFFLRRSYRYCATDGRYFRCPLFPRCSSRLIVDGDRPNSLAMVRILFP